MFLPQSRASSGALCAPRRCDPRAHLRRSARARRHSQATAVHHHPEQRLCSEVARQPQRIYYDYGADPNSGLPSGGHVEATMSTEDRDYHREENELNSVIDETAKRPKNQRIPTLIIVLIWIRIRPHHVG